MQRREMLNMSPLSEPYYVVLAILDQSDHAN